MLAAYADEGPTLRRFRPRARGRATRIRKRTSHITIVVTRLSDERLEVLQARQQATSPTARRRAGTSAQSRRDRVERSRTRAQGLRSGGTSAEEARATNGVERAAGDRDQRHELPEHTPAADVDAVDTAEVVADDVAEELEDAAAEQAAADIAESDLADEAETAGRDRHRRREPTPPSSPTARSWRRRTGRSRTATRSRATRTR